MSLAKRPDWVVFDFLGVIVPFGVGSGLSNFGPGKKQVADERIIALMRDLVAKNTLLAVASNSGRAWIESALGGITNLPEIKAIITPEIGSIKPDEAYFKHLVSTLQAKPETIMFIDDQQANCDAASRLGLRTFWYRGDLTTLKQAIWTLPD